MNGIRLSSLIRFFGLALLAACFNAGLARAQVFQGKFSLPFEARWGQATLPAGDYSFKLDNTSGTCMLRVYRGRDGVGMIMAQASDKASSDRAQLTVVRGTVRALNLPQIGIVLNYAPHHPEHLTAPEEREVAVTVPVSPAGK
jgi:hypothetical protein